MRIAIASDHGGFEQKQALVAYLAEDLGCEVLDMGPDSDASVDYPDYAAPVARAVASGEADRGVLVCGTGIGMALAADKVAGVRASSITSAPFAELFRQHNNGNVVCLSGRFVDLDVNKEIVKTFLSTEFEGGRHEGRVAKVMALD
ncbi:MAG: ribose 5-phosphate isomerase B [Slackia sp.]|nr:ribose 5-phosphate isomerase B [Slackia sp.]